MIHLEASSIDAGKRLDNFLRERLPDFSRSRLQELIEQGRVLVNGVAVKRASLIKNAQQIQVEPGPRTPLHAEPEDIPLTVLYEDDDLIAIDKPADMVVHAGAGRHSGTLVNALLHRFAKLSAVGGDLRPGIVHRLDRFTSGVILVARTDAAHQHLAAQFSGRKIEKTYLALVHGQMKSDHGGITTPITRDPVKRVRMTTKLAHGRSAITTYRVLQRFEKYSYLEVTIGTGRTHQIRVHLSSIGHPVAGDKLYGAPASDLDRYFLHAHRISFNSPSTGQRITVTSPLPVQLDQYKDALLRPIMNLHPS